MESIRSSGIGKTGTSNSLSERDTMRSFRRLTIWTLISVYILILVGGIVRSTGSGMGCPDWPKCFGNWVPPKTISELPPDYKQIYSEYRHKKNIKFSKYLRFIGMNDTANQLLNDKSVREEDDFNPTKTWIEYFNRIVGVIIGFLIFTVAVFSFRFRKTKRHITVIAVMSFLLVAFQGWIGSFVVSSNLTPWTVTVHMFLALVIVAMLVYLIDQSAEMKFAAFSSMNMWLILVCVGVVLVQILLGTRLREAVDSVGTGVDRGMWLEAIGKPFVIHRAFSWVVLILHGFLVFNLMKTQELKAFALALILLILGTILTGVGMAWFAIPPFLQPIHLLLATVIFGVQFFLLLRFKGNVKPVIEAK